MFAGVNAALSQCPLGTGEWIHSVQTFESGNLEITIDANDTVNPWQIAQPMKLYLDSALSAPNALITDSVNVPTPNDTSYATFVIDSVDITWWWIYFRFKHKFDVDSLHQKAYLECSFDSGFTWKLLENTGGGSSVCDAEYRSWQYCDMYTSDLALGPYFSGVSNGWVESGYLFQWYFPVRTDDTDTLPCAIPPQVLMLRFVFVNDSVQTGREGWMIDDVELWNVDPGGFVSNTDTPELMLFPNPTSDVLYVRNASVGLNYTVINVNGKRVMEYGTATNNAIDVSLLPDGFYIIEARRGNDVVGRNAFVKQ